MSEPIALPDVHVATPGERTAIAAMLARAFADDPAMTFIFPDAATRAQTMPETESFTVEETFR